MRVVNRKTMEARCTLDMIEGESAIYITIGNAGDIVTGVVDKGDEIYYNLLELFQRSAE